MDVPGSDMEEGNRLLMEMAEFLATIPPGFNLTNYTFPNSAGIFADPRDGCGSTACAIGFSPAIWPEEYAWDRRGNVIYDDEHIKYYHYMDRFCINDIEFDWLFMPLSYAHESWSDSLAVAERIWDFVADRRRTHLIVSQDGHGSAKEEGCLVGDEGRQDKWNSQ